jgi:hypothetical protein
MDVDLRELANYLDTVFCDAAPVGLVVGRTALRDALAQKLRCSQLQAEDLVERLVALRFLVYAAGESDDPGFWQIQPDPAAFI